MDFKLNLKQDIKLILTQEMQLSLNILEMSLPDLINFLEKEKKTNPAIEIIYPSKTYKSEDENYDLFETYSDEETLVDILEEQIRYLKLTPKVKETSIFIINNLDNKGYLAIPKKEITNFLNISNKVLKEALEVVNTLEPLGVGAQNLQECLKIQLKHKEINDINLYKIIDFYLQDLAKEKYDYIATSLNCEVLKVKEYLKIIQKLNPIPARGYKVKNTSTYISPDANITIIDNRLEYKINDENIPKVYINSTANVSQEKIDKISYIIKSIEKRYSTLERIIVFLLFAQKEFFFKGKKFLKTLSLKDMANYLELHESTVSRAIKDKFLNTPQGIVSFKSLFVYDENIFKIKDIIEKAIEEENPNSPYSDNQLSILLKSKGYEVARRTVTKYREDLGFKSSRERKRKN